MTISDLSMIWVNISPLYFCFISLFFEPLVLPYGSVYCFKFKIWYSRYYWSRSTKDPQPSLVCRCGFFRPSQVWVNIPKRKFRTELMHFSQSLPRATSNVGKIRFTRMGNSFVLPYQNWARTTNDNPRFILFAEDESTLKPHLVQKKSQRYMSSYVHRLKPTSLKWTSHISWQHCGPLHWIKKGSRRREKT